MTTTTITAGTAVSPAGIFFGGNDGAFSLLAGQDGAQRSVINGTSSGVLPYYNNTWSFSGTANFSMDGTNGQIQLITLTTAFTLSILAPASIAEGAQYTLIFKSGDTNSKTLSWGSGYKWPGGSVVLTTTSNTSGAYDIISFIGGPSNTLYYTGSLLDVR
jgi:hypothetical protein